MRYREGATPVAPLFTHPENGRFLRLGLGRGEGRLRLDGDDTLLVEPYALEDELRESWRLAAGSVSLVQKIEVLEHLTGFEVGERAGRVGQARC